MYVVERQDGGGWYSIGGYSRRDAAVSHAKMVREAIRRRGQSDRGRVRVIPQDSDIARRHQTRDNVSLLG